MAGLVAAGRDGIVKKMALPAGVDVNPMGMSVQERRGKGVIPIPSDLLTALDSLSVMTNKYFFTHTHTHTHTYTHT